MSVCPIWVMSSNGSRLTLRYQLIGWLNRAVSFINWLTRESSVLYQLAGFIKQCPSHQRLTAYSVVLLCQLILWCIFLYKLTCSIKQLPSSSTDWIHIVLSFISWFRGALSFINWLNSQRIVLYQLIPWNIFLCHLTGFTDHCPLSANSVENFPLYRL